MNVLQSEISVTTLIKRLTNERIHLVTMQRLPAEMQFSKEINLLLVFLKFHSLFAPLFPGIPFYFPNSYRELTEKQRNFLK